MKFKKIKNYILTFIVCLLGAFAFNSVETIAMVYDEVSNNYVSSNLIDNYNLRVGSINADGSISSSINNRLYTAMIPYDASTFGTRINYELFDFGSCNSFVGARFGIHSYTTSFRNSQIEDSGWINLTLDSYSYYNVPSNTKYISIVFSFSSTSSIITGNSQEVSSISSDTFYCIEFMMSNYSFDSYERYSDVFYYGSLISNCDVLVNNTSVFNCLPYVSYRQIGPTFDFSIVRYQLDYADLISSNFSYVLQLYDYLEDVGLYFDAFSNEGVVVSFYRDSSLLFSINLSDVDYINVNNYTNLGFNKIVIDNVNFDYSIKSFSIVNYRLVDSLVSDAYRDGFSDGSASDNTLVGMVGAIFTGPVTMFQEIFNFNVLGINFAEMLLGLVTLLVVIWLIKKFI